jgi:uncharacterized protein (DUF1501 family)
VNRKMSRRLLLRRMVDAALLGALPGLLPKSSFAETAYTGKLLVTVQFQGGWDVTSFCDPKVNQPGEKEINTWARSKSIGTAGKLRYAPYGSNHRFFEKHYDKMLVINGVDMQTNAHDTGLIVAWSGRTATGYPSITALHAATNGSDLPLAYMNLGGWSNTENIINFTRVGNLRTLRTLIYPNQSNWDPNVTAVSNSDLSRIAQLHIKHQQQQLAHSALLPQEKINRENYIDGLAKSGALKSLGLLIPTDDKIQAERPLSQTVTSRMHQQAQIALLAFKSGLSIAADLCDAGFDTHNDHDRDHEPLLSVTLDAVDYLWDYAEQLGLAERLIVVMGSDFGRTPYYNSFKGKDHWPIGSYVVMEKNRSYTNRIVGETDGGHNALKINPVTLARDDSRGTLIYSHHVHKALRRYLGLEGTALEKLFPFNTEDFKFFG